MSRTGDGKKLRHPLYYPQYDRLQNIHSYKELFCRKDSTINGYYVFIIFLVALKSPDRSLAK